MDDSSCEACKPELQVLWVWGLSIFQKMGRTCRILGFLQKCYWQMRSYYIGIHIYVYIKHTHTHICVYLSTHVEIYLQTHIHKYHSGEKHIYVYKCVVFLFHDLSMIYPLIYSKTFFSFVGQVGYHKFIFTFYWQCLGEIGDTNNVLDLTRTMNTTRNLVKESIC